MNKNIIYALVWAYGFFIGLGFALVLLLALLGLNPSIAICFGS